MSHQKTDDTIQINLNVEIQTSWKIYTEFMMNLTKHMSKILLLLFIYEMQMRWANI
jgi:hypothetical protein